MERKIRSLFILLALIIGTHPVQSAVYPSLAIVLTNNLALLHWPTNVTSSSYALQSGVNLTSTNWAFAKDALPVTYGSETALTVTNNPDARFFRLILLPATTPDNMVLIPAGSFTIGDVNDGDPRANAAPTNVYVSAFYMDTNLVTSNQWATVYTQAINHGYTFDHGGLAKAANHPVYAVNWYDAVKWCNARSQAAGLMPVYYTDEQMTMVYTNGETDVIYPNWWANGYRLPTEAEWEKAARGGLSGHRFPWGDTISESQANYYSSPGSLGYDLGPSGYNPIGLIGGSPYTSPVGSFPANGYGLYDMAGNIDEWCWDWYSSEPFQGASPYLGGIDPHGADSFSTFHVVRGGINYVFANDAACAYRDYYVPTFAGYDIGFRCVRGL